VRGLDPSQVQRLRQIQLFLLKLLQLLRQALQLLLQRLFLTLQLLNVFDHFSHLLTHRVLLVLKLSFEQRNGFFRVSFLSLQLGLS